jgi:DNA-binding MarR family transcriptional regulator
MTPAKADRDLAARQAWLAMSDLVFANVRRREVSEQVGMSFGKVRALRRIARRPMPMGELAVLLGVDPPNLTTLVDDLEVAGLVERQAHPTDRRAKLVVATTAGAAVARQAEQILERPPAALSEMPVDDLVTLARILSAARRDPEPGP